MFIWDLCFSWIFFTLTSIIKLSIWIWNESLCSSHCIKIITLSSHILFYPSWPETLQILNQFCCLPDSCAVRGGYALPPMWHHRAEKGWMWLVALHCLSHWDLLGNQRTSLGSQGKKASWHCSLLMHLPDLQEDAYTTLSQLMRNTLVISKL